MKPQHYSFHTSTCQQHLCVFRNDKAATSRKLMLLHGAGVGGELTWTFLAHYLTQWSEIYVPDLAGMGHASFLQNAQPQLEDYAQQLDELLEHLSLEHDDFDYAGYSFGGMLLEHWLRHKDYSGLVFLLEPAMLFSGNCLQVQEKAQDYAQVATAIFSGKADLASYTLFLDSVSPKRVDDPKADEITIQRLQDNPLGFAQALAAITQKLENDCSYYTNWQAPWIGASFVGGLSWSVMHQRHQRLAKESPAWHYEVVANADHSLVFTRPRSIAKVMNTVAERKFNVS